jgi:hypothetical protein
LPLGIRGIRGKTGGPEPVENFVARIVDKAIPAVAAQKSAVDALCPELFCLKGYIIVIVGQSFKAFRFLPAIHGAQNGS